VGLGINIVPTNISERTITFECQNLVYILTIRSAIPKLPNRFLRIQSSPQNTTLIPLDVTHQVLGTAEVRHGLLYGYDPWVSIVTKDDFHDTQAAVASGAKPSPVRALFAQILSFFAHTYAEVFALTSGPPLHDPLAVAAAIEPETFNDVGGERFLVDVVTEGVHAADKASVGELGRTKVTKLPMGQPGVRIPRGLDVTRFWYLTELALRSADATTPMAEVSWRKLREGGVV
jgi:uridine nucleosidase